MEPGYIVLGFTALILFLGSRIRTKWLRYFFFTLALTVFFWWSWNTLKFLVQC